VEADAGAIGGEGGTHEFMALADIGEDTIATCTHCDYAANLEKAQSASVKITSTEVKADKLEKIHTPGVRTIGQLTEHLQTEPQDIIKTLIYVADDRPLAVVMRGDHEVNEIKLKNYLGAENIELADAQSSAASTGVPVGFIGPVGIEIPILVDTAVGQMQSGIAGANETDYHFRNVVPGRDFTVERTGDFRNAKEGETCSRCSEGVLQFFKGIEVGHVFKLGTQYSETLGARYLDASGREQTMIMGCYGIGVSRILSAIVEQSHDDGMIWAPAIAPYHVHIIPVSIKDKSQTRIAEELYDRLLNHGLEVLIDDRDERPGVKFNDSDLIGIPFRIVVGKHAESGIVEYIERNNNVKQVMTVDDVISRIFEEVRLSS
jgi:prolyl-tRNA synthetase